VIATLYANTAAPWPLRDDTVHVWRFACQQRVGALAAVLSEDERTAARRFVAPAHREAYTVQHAMLRCLVARYVGRAPAQLAFARGPRGKPHLVDREVELNLSHAADVALLAVARCAVGVDIERLDTALDIATLARIVLAPDEPCADRRAFLRVWCRKEACLKATGVGLVDRLPAVSVASDRVVVDGETVFVRDLAMGDDHAAALATSVEQAAIVPHALETFRP
jgi:4'-phosphopantetheinyl transferase